MGVAGAAAGGEGRQGTGARAGPAGRLPAIPEAGVLLAAAGDWDGLDRGGRGGARALLPTPGGLLPRRRRRR